MWHQFWEKPPMSPRQSARQPAPCCDGILQALAAADEHHQRRLLERGQVGVDDLHAVLQRRQLAVLRAAQVPLAPPADRAEVDVVDVGMAVVPLAQPLDEVEVPLQHDRIVHVGDRKRAAARRSRHCSSLPPTSLSHVGMVRAGRGVVEQHITRKASFWPDVARLLAAPCRGTRVSSLPGCGSSSPQPQRA